MATENDQLTTVLQDAFSKQNLTIVDPPEIAHLMPDFGKGADDKVTVAEIDSSKQPEVKEEPKVHPALEVKAPETPVVDEKSSLNPEDKKPEPIVEKTFEQLLEEKSQGKYKSLEDINNVVNNTKPKYASAESELLDKYIADGGTYDDFVATQNIDFDKMDARDVMEYKILAQDPDMSDEEVAYEMKKQFGVDKWKDKPEEYEGEIEPEEIRMSKLRFNREANKYREELKANQKQWSIPAKKEVIQPESDPKLKEKWDTDVDGAIADLNKVPLKISDTESYDFVLDDAEKKEVSQVVKNLLTSSKDFWFMEKDGKINVKALTEGLIKMRNFDKAMKYVSAQAKAEGAKKVVTDLKNPDFKPEAKVDAPKVKTMAEQIAEQFATHQGFKI